MDQINPSSEFLEFAYKYDPAARPFFQTLVDDNLRLLKKLPTGGRLLAAIRAARPGFRNKYYPGKVNVVFQPTLNDYGMPGAKVVFGDLSVNDKQAYAETMLARGASEFGIFEPSPRKGGKLIPGLSAKAEAKEDNKAAASDGTGTTCHVFFTNSEMLSKEGVWFIPYLTMGHELIHCLHALTGTMDANDKNEEYKTTGIKGHEGLEFTENKLRHEAKFPLRTKYYPDD